MTIKKLELVHLSPIFLDTKRPSQGVSLFFRLHLDEWPLAEDLVADIDSLARSIRHSGAYRILICSCGNAACGSVVVDVYSYGNTIQWNNILRFDHSGRSQKITQDAIVFDLDQYSHVILTAEKIIAQQMQLYQPFPIIGPAGLYHIK